MLLQLQRITFRRWSFRCSLIWKIRAKTRNVEESQFNNVTLLFVFKFGSYFLELCWVMHLSNTIWQFFSWYSCFEELLQAEDVRFTEY